MNKLILIATTLLIIFNVVAQETTEINWGNKSEKVLIRYKSEKNENLIFLYYLDNDSIKMISFSDVYVSDEIKKSDVMEFNNLLQTDLKTIELYRSCIVKDNDTYLISSSVINLGKQEKAEIFLKVNFEQSGILKNVLTNLNRRIFFDYSTYTYMNFKIY